MLIENFKEHLSKNFPFVSGKKLLIACSGGLDSVTLAHLVHLCGYEYALAHCNFKLREGESDEDERFVEDLSKKYDVPFFSQTFDTVNVAKENKLSIQMAARELRYAWFEEIRSSFGYDYILTAHHRNDDFETFLINLSRGTGIRGLTGIPERLGFVLRPLLAFTRDQLLDFSKKKKLYWREDSSNAKKEYLRNALRHNVIPDFIKAHPKVLSGFSNTVEHLKDSQALIEDYMALVYNLAVTENFNGYSIHIEKLQQLPNTKALLYEMLHPFNFTAWNDIYDLLTAQPGKSVFSPTHRLTKDRGVLLLTTKDSDGEILPVTISKDIKEVQTPIHLVFEEVSSIDVINNKVCHVAREKLTYPLLLRKWREGDFFYPFGMKGKKKLSKFFKDEKVSLVAKANIYVLCSNDKIVWVVGFRMDDRFKVDSETQDILKISYLD
jgi:tRNA(Ile)-lysidine synthase